MPQTTFLIDDSAGGGDDFVGDAYAFSDGTPNTWVDGDAKTTQGFVGRTTKSTPELNCFFVFDLGPTISLGDRLDGVDFRFSDTGDADVDGNSEDTAFRLAVLNEDGTWEVNGFAASGEVSSGPFYTKRYEYPSGGGVGLPHATQDSSDTLEPSATVGWASLDILMANFVLQPSARMGIGQGTTGEPSLHITTVGFASPLTDVNFAFNWTGTSRKVCLTLDSQNVSGDINFFKVVLRDNTGPLNRMPELVIAWTANPPVFTSSPVTVGDVGNLYSYTAVADPFILGDQTGNNHLGVAFSLTVSPAGMTIDSATGAISWTPSVVQEDAVHDVTVRATNDGGRTVDQSYSVTIAKFGCPGGDAQARPSVKGSAEGRSTVSGRAESSPSVRGSASHFSAVTGTAVVRSAVSGSARRCPSEE